MYMYMYIYMYIYIYIYIYIKQTQKCRGFSTIVCRLTVQIFAPKFSGKKRLPRHLFPATCLDARSVPNLSGMPPREVLVEAVQAQREAPRRCRQVYVYLRHGR